MSSVPMTEAQVRALAVGQLPRAFKQVPASYIRELKGHLKQYPGDKKFTIIPRPGRAYGTVTCLEPGCGRAEVLLEADKSLVDGGLSIGIGGLSAYSVHCSNKHRRPAKAPSAGASSATGALRPNTKNTNGLRTPLSKIKDDKGVRKPKLKPSNARPKEKVVENDGDDDNSDDGGGGLVAPESPRSAFGDLHNTAPSLRASSPGISGLSSIRIDNSGILQTLLDRTLDEKKSTEDKISYLCREEVNMYPEGELRRAKNDLKRAEVYLAELERTEAALRRSLATSIALFPLRQRGPMRNGVEKEESPSKDSMGGARPHDTSDLE